MGATKQKIVRTGGIWLPGQNAISAKKVIGDVLEMARQGAFVPVREPVAFAIDEPLSHLDARLRAELKRFPLCRLVGGP